MDYQFQIFGSSSSVDVDVMVFVDKIETIDSNHTFLKDMNDQFKDFFISTPYEGKKVNCNLAVLKDGIIIEVFKGTVDECNNSLLDTYSLHEQFCDNHIQSRYDRTKDEYYHLKLKRVLRFIISFYSRLPEMRPQIKLALKGDVRERIKAIKMIDLRIHKQFPKKKESLEDIYKVIAFQLCQSIMLSKGIEVYTKEDAAIMIPLLKPFLYRDDFSDKQLEDLQFYLEQLITICNYEASSMVNQFEECDL